MGVNPFIFETQSVHANCCTLLLNTIRIKRCTAGIFFSNSFYGFVNIFMHTQNPKLN